MPSKKKIIDADESGKSLKKISTQFDISKSDVRKLIYKWKKKNQTYFQNAQTMLFQYVQSKMLKEFSPNLKISSRDIQVALAIMDTKYMHLLLESVCTSLICMRCGQRNCCCQKKKNNNQGKKDCQKTFREIPGHCALQSI